jgi:hypothetical protein
MEYQPSGKISVFGRSEVLFRETYEIYYDIGSRVYIRSQAKKGILETIIIKKIHRNMPDIYSGVIPIVSYVDMTNRVWLEDELADQNDAFDFYHVYWSRIKKMAEELLQYPNVN